VIGPESVGCAFESRGFNFNAFVAGVGLEWESVTLQMQGLLGRERPSAKSIMWVIDGIHKRGRAMSDYPGDSTEQKPMAGLGIQSLSPEEISQLLLAGSLSATKPLLGLIKYLIQAKILEADRLKAFLTPMLVDENLPPTTKAMLDPLWKAFLAQIAEEGGVASS